jgi:hypothetical protein
MIAIQEGKSSYQSRADVPGEAVLLAINVAMINNTCKQNTV